MKSSFLIPLSAIAIVAKSQTYTLSSCHRHGQVGYCYLPDGSETPWTTYAETETRTAMPTASATVDAVAEVTDDAPSVIGCHFHEESQSCMVDGAEYEVASTVDPNTAPEAYSGCHFHGEEIHCTGGGVEVTLKPMGSAAGGDGHSHASETSANAEGISCHDHAGVKHCVDANGNTVSGSCSKPERDYDVPLRIGLLFVILITSAIGVFGPILTSRFTGFDPDHVVLVAMRQFGTGIIISTAIVHLATHAELFFSSDCLNGVFYEATAGAILMAGTFITFVIEYMAHRWNDYRLRKASLNTAVASTSKDAEVASTEKPSEENLTLKTTVMEAGIIFHSILIGITLVVAGDSGFITLFIVILFHQMFEGLALGSRIAIIPRGPVHKLLLGLAFAVTTPIGMAIGIGVLSSFNGNDPSTIIAIGTLNAFSAGILLWVGAVEMWFVEWFHGALSRSGVLKTAIGMLSLVSGLVVMSVLGKWA